jgi:hypothetical protein
MKPVDGDNMGEPLNVLQAFSEFLKHLYLRNHLTFIRLIRYFSRILVGRMDYPYRPQFQTTPLFHPSNVDDRIVDSSNYTTDSQRAPRLALVPRRYNNLFPSSLKHRRAISFGKWNMISSAMIRLRRRKRLRTGYSPAVLRQSIYA